MTEAVGLRHERVKKTVQRRDVTDIIDFKSFKLVRHIEDLKKLLKKYPVAFRIFFPQGAFLIECSIVFPAV